MTESALAPAESRAVSAMCNTCDEIDMTIQRYRRIKERVAEQALVDRARELIAEMEADKAALHPEGRLH
jgi:hypothetical protein